MANYFDQFDTPAAGANYFDQFDAPSRAAQSLIGASAHVKPEPGNMLTDILPEIASAASNAISSGARNLNPFSEDRRASIERQSKMPFFSLDSFKEQFGRLGSTGGGMMAPLDLAASPVVGAGRSIIGHGMEAITPGMDYEEGKAAADKAMMAVRAKGVTRGGQMATLPPVVPAAAEIKAAGSAGYKSPDVAALGINPSSTAAAAANIESEFLTQGFRPTRTSAKDVFTEIHNLTPPKGVQSIGAADIDSARQALSLYAKETDKLGKPTTQAKAASKAIAKLDAYMDNLSFNDIIKGDPKVAQSTLKDARGNWASASQAEGIDYRLSRAERQAAKSGMGSNIENAMRQKVDQVPDLGLSAKERALRDKIVMGDKPRNFLRAAGKLGVDGGLSLLAHAGFAASTGGWTLPVAVAGTVARKVGEALTKRQIAELNEMIRKRSPLAKSMPYRQLLPPSPLFGAVLPYGLPQRLPMLMGRIPANAEDEQEPNLRRGHY